MQLCNYELEVKVPGAVGKFQVRDILKRSVCKDAIKRMYGEGGKNEVRLVYRKVAVSDTNRMSLYEVHENESGMVCFMFVVLHVKKDGTVKITRENLSYSDVLITDVTQPGGGYRNNWNHFNVAKNMKVVDPDIYVRRIRYLR